MSRKGAPTSQEGESIYRIPPYYYIHVLDQNTNVTKVEVGPKTFIRQDNEKVAVLILSLFTCSGTLVDNTSQPNGLQEFLCQSLESLLFVRSIVKVHLSVMDRTLS